MPPSLTLLEPDPAEPLGYFVTRQTLAFADSFDNLDTLADTVERHVLDVWPRARKVAPDVLELRAMIARVVAKLEARAA